MRSLTVSLLVGACASAALAGGLASGAAGSAASLAFISIRTGDAQVWVRDASGSERMLTDGRSINVQPALSSTGWLAFVSRQGTDKAAIQLIREDGSGQRRLSQDDRVEMAPSWSPDGKQLAYFSMQQETGSTELRIVDVATGAQKAVKTEGKTMGPAPAVWSADGQRLVFLAGDAKGASQVWTVNADGAQLRNLSAGFPSRAAAWVDLSPDGKQIVWAANLREKGTHLIVTSLQSGESRNLTEGAQGTHESPRWSPDGRRLSFASTRDSLETGRADVFVMDADGSNVRNISRHPGEDFDPKWSGDGRSVLFLSLRSGTSLIYSADVDGAGEAQALSRHASHDMEHAVRPLVKPR